MRLIQLTRGGADGYTPHIGENGNWWLGAYDTGIKADFSTEESIREQQEGLRAQAEALREQEEEGRVLSEVARKELMALIEQSIRDVLRSMSNVSERVTGQGEDAARQGTQAEQQGNRAELQGSEAQKQGSAAQAQGEEAARQGTQAELQGNRAELQGSEAQKQGDTAQAQGEEAARQGSQAEQQGNKAEEIGAGLEDRMNRIENKPTGLRFKSGDNSVYLKSPVINLGTDDFTIEIWARTQGGKYTVPGTYPLLGFSKEVYGNSSLKIHGADEGNNDLLQVYFPSLGSTSNVIMVDKRDKTLNLHHIVIIKSELSATAIINGRLVKSIKLDRITDFSEFVFDIANTSFFSFGRVFNYAMTHAESNRLLWYGGRCNEVQLPLQFADDRLAGKSFRCNYSTPANNCIYESIEGNTHFRCTARNSGMFNFSIMDLLWQELVNKLNYSRDLISQAKTIKIVYKSNADCYFDNSGYKHIIPNSNDLQTELLFSVAFPDYWWVDFIKIDSANAGDYIEIIEYTSTIGCCVLEYLPASIRKDRIINTGTLGRDYDGLFSPIAPEVIYEPQYKDKRITTGAPNYHPIAMGQEVYSETGHVWKACLPPVSREWGVNDWKQINR